ncbi:hypothetical protein BJX76DRAFT_355050 [Aspergillus varians]
MSTPTTANEPDSQSKHLMMKIEEAFPNTSSLNLLLPEIISAPTTQKHITYIFNKAAATNNIECFRFIVPIFAAHSEAFDKNWLANSYTREEHYRYICEHGHSMSYHGTILGSFRRCMESGNRVIAEDILDLLLRNPTYGLDHDQAQSRPQGSLRRVWLAAMLGDAVRHDDPHLVARICEVSLPIDTLKQQLRTATEGGRREIVAALLANLMEEKEKDSKFVARMCRVSEADEIVGAQVMKLRAEAVKASLGLALEVRQCELIDVLLPVYLECAVAAHRNLSGFDELPILKDLTDDDFERVLTREQCFRFLGCRLSPILSKAIFRRLTVHDAICPTESILIKAGGKQFRGHRDVLRYWSKYFDLLSRNNWADNADVDFDCHIDPTVMQAVLDFMYCGEYVDQGALYRREFMTQVWEAADYLQIDELKGIVGKLMDELGA